MAGETLDADAVIEKLKVGLRSRAASRGGRTYLVGLLDGFKQAVKLMYQNDIKEMYLTDPQNAQLLTLTAVAVEDLLKEGAA